MGVVDGRALSPGVVARRERERVARELAAEKRAEAREEALQAQATEAARELIAGMSDEELRDWLVPVAGLLRRDRPVSRPDDA